MHPDLQHLVRLQQLDSDIDTARRRIAEIPLLQQALEARLANQENVVTSLKQRLADNQTSRRDIERDVAAVQTRLSKYKDQLMEVKTNKEYQAMQHEIASAQTAVRAQEDRILESMEEAETLTRDLKAAETDLKRQQGEIAAEQKMLGEESAALEGQIDDLWAGRADLAKQLSPTALALFDHVSKQRKGLALAEARDGVCTVCHVRLRPQVYNEVRRNEQLIQCESCLRVLYFVPSATPESADAASRD